MEQWKDCLAALLPYYSWSGENATLIFTVHGEVIADRRTVKWNLQRLARFYCVDLQAARSYYARLLHCQQGVPLPFSPSLVLVPLKVRPVIGKNDGSCGYINPEAVQACSGTDQGATKCLLRLAGGQTIPSLYTVRTVQRRLQAGRLVAERYRSRLITESICKDGSELNNLSEQRQLLKRLAAALFSSLWLQDRE
jgi:hypothetical protein